MNSVTYLLEVIQLVEMYHGEYHASSSPPSQKPPIGRILKQLTRLQSGVM